MDEKMDRRLRRKALRWLCLGKQPSEVLKRRGRSRTWLSKWRTRFGEQGTAGLRSQARRPCPPPQAWASERGEWIVRTRKRLSRAPAGLMGARALRPALKQWMPRRAVPSTPTLYRRVHQAGRLAPQPLSAAPSFPAPSEEVAGSLEALDWTCRSLAGGTKG
jgi:transposase